MNSETSYVYSWLLQNEEAFGMAYRLRKYPIEFKEWLKQVHSALDDVRRGAVNFELIDIDTICRQIDFD